jgi:hypothetical protein
MRPLLHLMLHKTGKIEYFFKGMKMQSDLATVIDCDDKQLTVLRKSDEQLVSFTHSSGLWLLKNNETSKSPLYGTHFSVDE